MAKRDPVELGDEVKDMVTGFQGIAIGRTTWLQGCDRITVQPSGLDKEGKTKGAEVFDEPQLEIVKRKKVPAAPKDRSTVPGGPNSANHRACEVKRR